MTPALPTEEDVLAHLILHVALAEILDGPLANADRVATVQAIWANRPRIGVPMEEALVQIGRARVMAHVGRTHRDAQRAAIADSERRLEVERARDAVVEAARAWGVSFFAGKRSNGDLLSAVCMLEAAEMRRW